MSHKGKDQEYNHQPEQEGCVGQRLVVCKGSHQAVHQQIQDAHAAHDDKVDDDRPEGSLFDIFYALVGEGEHAI